MQFVSPCVILTVNPKVHRLLKPLGIRSSFFPMFFRLFVPIFRHQNSKFIFSHVFSSICADMYTHFSEYH